MPSPASSPMVLNSSRATGGASWREFFEVALLCGSYAVPLPLVQTMAARTLVREPGKLPCGLLTFAPSIGRDHAGALQAFHVPMARVASHVIGADGERLVLLRVDQARQTPSGVHGSLGASLRWEQETAQTLTSAIGAEQFQAIGALLHAGLLAGAMKRAFDMTMAYADERVQFGKSIGKFQAIQHQLSVMAEHVAAARMAAESAFASGMALPSIAVCALAKARTSEAAQLVASTAHAVHGAIGITEEYDLQLYTRRLHEWRIAHGSETCWHRVIGRQLLASSQGTSVDFIRALTSGGAA